MNRKNRVNGVSRRGIADESRVDLAHFIEASEILLLEIKRAFGLFYCHALKGMGIDHGGLYIGVAHQFLYDPNVNPVFKQVGGPAFRGGINCTMPKGMG